jgi:hypothetical protein
VRQTVIAICRGLSHPTGWAEKPSQDINSRLFLMNKKGFILFIFHILMYVGRFHVTLGEVRHQRKVIGWHQTMFDYKLLVEEGFM